MYKGCQAVVQCTQSKKVALKRQMLRKVSKKESVNILTQPN